MKDEPSYNDYSHSAVSDGQVVSGSYSVLLPDGRKQVVTYRADEFGYVADVTYDGEPIYPAYDPAAFPAFYKPSYPNSTYPINRPGYLNYPRPGYFNYPRPSYLNYPRPSYPNYPRPGYLNYPRPGYLNYPRPGYPFFPNVNYVAEAGAEAQAEEVAAPDVETQPITDSAWILKLPTF